MWLICPAQTFIPSCAIINILKQITCLDLSKLGIHLSLQFNPHSDFQPHLPSEQWSFPVQGGDRDVSGHPSTPHHAVLKRLKGSSDKSSQASYLFNSAHKPPVLPLPVKAYLVVTSWFLKQNLARRMSVPFTEYNAVESALHPWGWIFCHCAASWILMSRFPITLMKQFSRSYFHHYPLSSEIFQSSHLSFINPKVNHNLDGRLITSRKSKASFAPQSRAMDKLWKLMCEESKNRLNFSDILQGWQ